mgnify:CR=1 FL=1
MTLSFIIMTLSSSLINRTMKTTIDTLINTEVISGTLSLDNVIHVSKNGNDTRGDFSNYNASRPFLTVGAAETAALSGDVINVYSGDYSSETLAGKDGVTYNGLDNVTLPSFQFLPFISPFTIYGSGKCNDFTCANDNAIVNMGDMDVMGNTLVNNGEVYIGVLYNTCNFNGSSVSYVKDIVGNASVNNNSKVTVSNSTRLGGIGNAYVLNNSSILHINGGIISSDATFAGLISTSFSWDGELLLNDVRLEFPNQTDLGSAINIGGSSGFIQMKNCSCYLPVPLYIISGTLSRDIYIQGTFCANASSNNITFVGGTEIVNANFR